MTRNKSNTVVFSRNLVHFFAHMKWWTQWSFCYYAYYLFTHIPVLCSCFPSSYHLTQAEFMAGISLVSCWLWNWIPSCQHLQQRSSFFHFYRCFYLTGLCGIKQKEVTKAIKKAQSLGEFCLDDFALTLNH